MFWDTLSLACQILHGIFLLVWSVIFSSSCDFFPSFSIRSTSSIQRRLGIFHSVFGTAMPFPASISSLFISSIISVYSMTNRSPPCLMLSLMVIFLVLAPGIVICSNLSLNSVKKNTRFGVHVMRSSLGSQYKNPHTIWDTRFEVLSWLRDFLYVQTYH